MLRLPQSPRARRRLLGTAVVGTVASALALTVVLLPSHGPTTTPARNEGPAKLAADMRAMRLTRADRRAIDAVLDRFLPAAMERKNPDVGWALAGPELKSGSTLAGWRRGESPVPFYEASETTFHDWQTIDVGPRYVVFNLLVHPKQGSTLAPYVFSGEVVKQHGRWLVNRLYTIAIMNKPTKHHQTPEVGPADFAAGAAVGSSGTSDTTAHRFRILPVLAVLAAIVLVPLLLGGIALRQALRWRRRVQSSGTRAIPPLPERYRS
ncbi:MAG: hypothetical protein ACRDM1_03640 [Gaiellaceae bacterium]